MAQQERGWPLGLQPLNVRVGLVRRLDVSRSGSLSFSTLMTGSPSASSATSSDFDTESTWSSFRNRSITLGSLLGITSILELSSRSLGRRRRQDISKTRNSHKTRTWFSLCARTHDLSSETAGDAPSLGHFLEEERRASNVHRKNQDPITYELNELPEIQPTPLANSLFSNGFVVPPQVAGDGSPVLVGDGKKSRTPASSDDVRGPDKDLSHGTGFGLPLLLLCMGGQSSH